MTLENVQCPHCNQLVSGVIPQHRIPRIRIKQISRLKEEVYANLESKTSWGKNELKDMLDTVFDAHMEDA